MIVDGENFQYLRNWLAGLVQLGNDAVKVPILEQPSEVILGNNSYLHPFRWTSVVV